MAAYTRFTKEEIKELHNLYKQGQSLKEIADYFGCSVSAIRYHLRKNKKKYKIRYILVDSKTFYPDSIFFSKKQDALDCLHQGQELYRVKLEKIDI